ncbi:hypothetical protein ASE05_10325 [Mesorhizobium sp. Root172]|nr:hypothetical protein ASE05_10325 [Mesorhizobium sp. Root172]
MALGDVFKFGTDQAEGHSLREKYHVFLGETDHFRATGPFAFLFISSADYDGCFPISADGYRFLRHDSFISCGNLVFYTQEYLDQAAPERVGKISAEDLQRLREHLAEHDVMVQWQITLACTYLDKARTA